MRWLIVFVIACLVFNGIRPWLERVGLGRLPGDFTIRWRGREWYVPLASSVVLSVIALLIGALI